VLFVKSGHDVVVPCKETYHVLQRRSRKWRYSCKCVPRQTHERKGGEKEEATKVQAANQIFQLLDWSIRLSSRFWTYFSADPIGIASVADSRNTWLQLNVSSVFVKQILIVQ